MRSFDIANTGDVLLASGRAFAISAREVVRKLYATSPQPEGESFGAILDDVEHARMADAPRLRHWVGTSGSLLHALATGIDPDPSAVSHLFVDDLAARRIYDLHSFRLVEAWVDDAIRASRPFRVVLDMRPPRRIVLGRLGTLELDADAEPPVTIEGDKQGLSARFGDVSLNVDAEGRARVLGEARFHPGRVYRHAVGAAEIPVHDAGLREPYHANAAIVRSLRAIDSWQGVLTRALDLLVAVDARVASECLDLCPAVLPLHNGGISFGSASPEEMVGLVYLPAIPSVDDVAECLLHEAMHQKLYRLEACARLFEPDTPRQEAYYSPWRTDARPLRMVLHGAYVFAGVAELWRRVWESGGRHEEHAERVVLRARQSTLALDVISRHAHLTKIGARLVSGLRGALDGLEDGVDLPPGRLEAVEHHLSGHAERHAAYVR